MPIRFWTSWVDRTFRDADPISPVGDEILGWWTIGKTFKGDPIMFALVEVDDTGRNAQTQHEARKAIRKYWPAAGQGKFGEEWRFFDEVTLAWRPTDRYPIAEWMRDRIEGSRR